MNAPSLPRLALIGISGYGRIHLQLARDSRDRGEAVIAAAVVINVQEEADNVAELRAHGCEIFTDYHEMLRSHAGRIDLCLIPTGIHWHARMTLAALEAGAHVLVEKPLAGSMDEVRAIDEAQRRTARFVAVGFQDYYDPAAAWLKARLVGREIGALRSIRFLGIWPRNHTYFLRNNWAGRLQVDGTAVLDSPLNNAFAHFVMLSLFFAGPTAVEAAASTVDSAELFRAHAIESFDTAVVLLHTAENVRLWMGVSHSCGETCEPEIVIEGEHGSAGWRYEKEVWVQRTGENTASHPMPATSVTRSAMMSAVLRRLREPTAPICTVAVAARHTALIEAIHRAAPVVAVPAGRIAWRTDAAGARWPNVTGLETALRRAFQQGGTLRAECFPPDLTMSAAGKP